MKTAIYIENGVLQLVITPEDEFEKNAIRLFEDKKTQMKIFSGSFYDCRGGWVRQSQHYASTPFGDNQERSIIIRLETEDGLPKI